MKTKRLNIIVSLVFAAALFITPLLTMAQPMGPGGGPHRGNGPGRMNGPHRPGRGPICGELTEEQREILHETISSMREEGSSREEIREAIKQLFEDWGIDMPERPARPQRPFRGWFNENLSEEQKAELKELAESLKEQNATRQEIHQAVIEQLKEWGFEPPERPGPNCRPGRIGAQLTPEQREDIRELVQTLKSQGATRREIRQAVREILAEWGIQSQDKPQPDRQSESAIKASNAPNPFNPSTTISYTLEEPGHVSVKIFNTQGQLIRTLFNGQQSSGTHSILWNGLDEHSEKVSTGLYFYRIESGNKVLTKRMMLMK